MMLHPHKVIYIDPQTRSSHFMRIVEDITVDEFYTFVVPQLERQAELKCIKDFDPRHLRVLPLN